MPKRRQKRGQGIERLKLRRSDLLLFFVILLIYIIHVVPGGGSNPNRYFDLIHSAVNNRTIYIDAYRENTLIDIAYRDGHYYSAGLPGPSLLGIPAYLAFKVVYDLIPNSMFAPLSSLQSFQQGLKEGFYARDNLDFFLSTIWIPPFSLSLLSALAAVLLFRLLLGLGVSRVYALVATVIYAFGTLVFFYSTTYYSHVFDASIAVIALYLLFRFGSALTTKRLLVVGLVAGFAGLMEYQGFIVFGCIGLYILVRFGFKFAAAFGIGVLFPLAILLAYNSIAFGGPFHVPQEFLDSPNKDRFFTGGFLGLLFPSQERILGLSIMPDRGIFVYCPILLLTFVGWYATLRSKQHPIFGLSLISMLAFTLLFLFNASLGDWRGGSSYGPRYLTAALPFMAIGLAFALPIVPKLVWVPLAALSIFNNWLGAQFGFAKDIFELWQDFASQGFVLPWVSAVLSHSRGSNPVLALVSNWGWLINLVYMLVILLGAWMLVLVSRDGKMQIATPSLE